MSTNTRKAGKKESKHLSVTTRCVAIVFKRDDTNNEVIYHDAPFSEKLHVELHEDYKDKVKKTHGDKDQFDAKSVLDEFKFRNKTCYWNPALVDSIKSLEYVGFIEPLTILVKGDDIHLENVRTAWGRRVLKDPAHYKIERIGDVNGIEMQIVPQTQFIPLPEALCLVIMDLNNKQIVATLETVCEKLKDCYHGLHLPSNQLVYETLGTLIRERKVFHTGCGYFVVTPDTFRFHGDEMQSTLIAPWTHLHPMYIPAVFGQPFRQPTRSISCQVDAEDNMIGQIESCDKVEPIQQNKMKDGSLPRTQRSMSFSVRRSRDRTKKDEVGHDGSLKRSSSLKGRNDKENKPAINDTNSEPVVKAEKLKKDKVSFFSKLFGRNKKKADPTPKKPAVEYASFSAQFPPPEWTWYQQQMDKQVRTETWVQQQIVKSGTWHHLNSLPTEFGPGTISFGANSVPDRSSPVVNKNETVNQNYVSNVTRRSHRKSNRNKVRSPLVIVNSPSEGASPIDFNDYHTYRNSMGQPSIRLSSLPTRMSQGHDVVHSNYVSHPRLSSTPRTMDESYKPSEVQQEWITKQGKGDKVKSHGSKKTHKSRKSKTHANRHSSYYPSSRHISGMSGNLTSQFSPDPNDGDISVEYHGRMPEKYCSLGLSRSSGVNCFDLEHNDSQHKGHRSHRSRSYRQSFNEYDVSVRQDCEGAELLYQNTSQDRNGGAGPYGEDTVNAHIYANVHITNSDEVKPKLPERTHRKVYTDRCTYNDSVDTYVKESVPDHYRLDVSLADQDGHSEHSSEQGTVQSGSSQDQSSQDSLIDGTESSEHSLGTVIDTQSTIKSHTDSQMSSLGDSGFSSSHVTEKKGDCNLSKEQYGFMCNDLKSEKNSMNNSHSKLDAISDDSMGRITSDAMYDNVRYQHREVLNNMKYLHKEINVSSQNLNNPPMCSESNVGKDDFNPKQPVVKKFNFEGDFHVVGVV